MDSNGTCPSLMRHHPTSSNCFPLGPPNKPKGGSGWGVHFIGSALSASSPKNGRLANRYFVHKYFELQWARETHIFRELAGRLFLPEGSSLFPPFLPLSGSLLGTFHGFSKYPFAKYPFVSFRKKLGPIDWPKLRGTQTGLAIAALRSRDFQALPCNCLARHNICKCKS